MNDDAGGAPLRIVHLDPAGHLGGAERSLLDVIASLKAARPRWAQRLIAGSDGPLLERARALGVDVTVMPLPPALAALGDAGAGGPAGHQVGRLKLAGGVCCAAAVFAPYALRLANALKEFAPDLVHSNGFKMHILAAWAAPRRIPLLWHVRDYVGARPLMAHLIRLHSRRCAAALANSLSVADDLRAACGAKLKVVPVYNAIDLQQFSPTGSKLDLDRAAGLRPAPPGTVRVGLVAAMARWKGQEIFLRALSMVPADIGVRGYVIGAPLYRTNGSQYSLDELRAVAARFGLSGRVGFTGFVDEPAAAMRALDIVVHASTAPEPFGRAVAEGMACGRAVIMSDVGGVTEIAADGIDVLFHPHGDAAALARKIAALALDTGWRARLGAGARETAERRFRRDRMAQEIIAVYRALSPAAEN